jgi:DNA modification methylase
MNTLEKESFGCIVTSPPYYWQRDYEVEGQIGLEWQVEGYVEAIATTMDAAARLLAKDGLLFLNLGDTYYSKKGKPKGSDKKNWARRFGLRAVDTSGLGLPRKTAIGMPWRIALRMVDRGWTLRAPIVWRREHVQPEPTARDRPWRSYEMVFMFSRRPVYHFDRRSLDDEEDVWTIHSQSKVTNKLRSAYFPESLVGRCLKVGCKAGAAVLDPFAGSGTVLYAALAAGHPAVGIDLSGKACQYMVSELGSL